MCSRITCPSCGKPSWAGCGAHVEAVLGNVPKDERCKCKPDPYATTRDSLGIIPGRDRRR